MYTHENIRKYASSRKAKQFEYSGFSTRRIVFQLGTDKDKRKHAIVKKEMEHATPDTMEYVSEGAVLFPYAKKLKETKRLQLS